MDHALNGGVMASLIEEADLDDLRAHGVFFTPSTLADSCLSRWTQPSFTPRLIVDPACGAGDLLLAAARALPIHGTVRSTLRSWGTKLAGTDVFHEFARTARARLALLARARGARHDGSRLKLSELLPRIRKGDGLQSTEHLQQASHVILNPPYTLRQMSHDWRIGRGSMAAEFVEHCLATCAAGTHITAILPEVLRTGTSYSAWRGMVGQRAQLVRIESKGRFGAFCDVDVFVAHLVVGAHTATATWDRATSPRGRTIGDLFDVRVGRVVPHRHEEGRGATAAYLHARNSPAWGTVRRISEHRAFQTVPFEPPFVVIRRTSRPGDAFRAIPTVVTGSRPVQVENHLFVLSPRDGQLRTCELLLGALQDTRTTEWLDERIRCRHLTSSAVSGIPLRF